MDHERQRRLSVENRLVELRTKHGRDLEDLALPEWLDSMEGFLRQRRPVDRAVIYSAPAVEAPQEEVSLSRSTFNGSPVVQSVNLGDLDV